MNCSIWVFDYDGTLSNSAEESVSSSVVQLLHTIQNNSKLVLATGRPKQLMPEIPGLEWDAAVYFNGQLCIAGEQIVYRRLLENPEWQCFCHALQQRNIPYLAFSDRVTTTLPPSWLLRFPEVAGSKVVNGYPQNEPFLYKFIIEPSWQAQCMVSLYMPSAQIVKWHPEFWEIVPSGIEKNEGVERVLPFLHGNWEEVIAFGDSANDCMIFQKACCSVAVGDHCLELVRLATWVAPAIEEDGLERAISQLLCTGEFKP